jgi:CheY-like chemotaxis protein
MLSLLLAEDERDLREFLSEELADAGYDVTAVGSGADAIVAAAERRFDVYLLGLDGIQTIRVLRKITPAVPIVGLTGYMGQGYVAQAANWGVTCLAKPVKIDALLNELADAQKMGACQGTAHAEDSYCG